MAAGAKTMHHNLETINTVTAALVLASWPLGWLHDIYDMLPTPTACYMVVSALFMLFQMSDKLGWLDRLKRPKQEHTK